MLISHPNDFLANYLPPARRLFVIYGSFDPYTQLLNV